MTMSNNNSASVWVKLSEAAERQKTIGVSDFKVGDIFVGRYIKTETVMAADGKERTYFVWQPLKLKGDVLSGKDGQPRKFKASNYLRKKWLDFQEAGMSVEAGDVFKMAVLDIKEYELDDGTKVERPVLWVTLGKVK
jgi:hypothetical protein